MSFVAVPHDHPWSRFMRWAGLRPAIKLDVSDRVDSLLRQTPKESRAVAVLALCGLSRGQIMAILELSDTQMARHGRNIQMMQSTHDEKPELTYRERLEELITTLYPHCMTVDGVRVALNDMGMFTPKGVPWTTHGLRCYCSENKINLERDFSKMEMRMMELVRNGHGYPDVARILNEEGFKSKAGGQFSRKLVATYMSRSKGRKY